MKNSCLLWFIIDTVHLVVIKEKSIDNYEKKTDNRHSEQIKVYTLLFVGARNVLHDCKTSIKMVRGHISSFDGKVQLG